MRAYDSSETEYRTESGGFKKYFKDYGIFFIVSAVIFVAAFLCKTFVFSFENGLPDEDNYKHANYIGQDNESEIVEAMLLGERFDNEIVNKIPLGIFILGYDEVMTLSRLMGGVSDGNVSASIMFAVVIASISPIYLRVIYQKVNDKRNRMPTKFFEKAVDFVSLYFLESAVLYFLTVAMFFVARFTLEANVTVLVIIFYILYFTVMIIPFALGMLNFLLNSFAFPYVVTISNAINEAMENGGTEDPTRGIILSVIAVAMVLVLVFVREKLNDLIVKLIMKIIELIGRLFKKIKGIFRRKA